MAKKKLKVHLQRSEHTTFCGRDNSVSTGNGHDWRPLPAEAISTDAFEVTCKTCLKTAAREDENDA
jgi:hypothetical protein